MHLLQEHGTFARVHHFDALLEHSAPGVKSHYDTRLPKLLERYATVNGFRYGVNGGLGSQSYAAIYLETLQFLEDALQGLRRRFNARGMTLSLRAPTWTLSDFDKPAATG